MRTFSLLTILALCMGSSACRTAAHPDAPRTTKDFEPNYLVWNREPGIDDQVEARLSYLFPWTERRDSSWPKVHSAQLYASFAGRISQVLNSQESAPVFGRRYNPEVFWRMWLDDGVAEQANFVDVAFGHESNGQTINSEDELNSKISDLDRQGDDPDRARRFLSRGWDYAGLTWRTRLGTSGERFAYFRGRYFFPNGPLQPAEDYFPFEGSDELQRRAKYDGLTLTYRDDSLFGGDSDLRASYTTGYEHPLRSSTLRLEWTNHNPVWPITIFAQTGYNNDFATYYTHTTSYGIGVELR